MLQEADERTSAYLPLIVLSSQQGHHLCECACEIQHVLRRYFPRPLSLSRADLSHGIAVLAGEEPLDLGHFHDEGVQNLEEVPTGKKCAHGCMHARKNVSNLSARCTEEIWKDTLSFEI